MRRWYRGGLSAMSLFTAPLGRVYRGPLRSLASPERLDKGLTLILPGIEAESFFNHSVAYGLADGGVPTAIVVHDWTTTWVPMFLYHLRAWKRNLRAAQTVADRILAYQRDFPGRPVNLVGHSAGGAMALLALRQLPPENAVDAVLLLGAAVSPGFDLSVPLARVKQKIWNITSKFDWIYLGLGTLFLGTVDGRHAVCAGARGFHRPPGLSPEQSKLYDERLVETPFSRSMLRSFNLGGHFGYTNRVFVEEWLAPLLLSPPPPSTP